MTASFEAGPQDVRVVVDVSGLPAVMTLARACRDLIDHADVDGEWRLRLYRPWRALRLVEARRESFLAAFFVLVVGAGWIEA